MASDLTAVLWRFSTTWGDQMTAAMSSAVTALLESERGGTLLDLRRFSQRGTELSFAPP